MMSDQDSFNVSETTPQGKQILTRFLPAPDTEERDAQNYFFELVDDPERYNAIAGKRASDIVIRRAALRERLGVTPKNEIVYQYPEGRKYKGLKNGKRSFWWEKSSDQPAATLWALDDLQYAENIFVTEGESDALQLNSDLLTSAKHQDVSYVVAALANATAVQNLDVERFKNKRVWLVMDQDAAGVTAKNNLIERLKPVAKEISYLEWDSSRYGKDWCDLVDHDETYAFELLDEGWKKVESDFPPFKLAKNLVVEDLPNPDVLIEGLFFAETLGVIGGGSKSYKSWSLLDLAVSVAHGLPFWGFKTYEAPVLFINFEIGESFLQRRLKPIMVEKGLAELNENLVIWTLRGRATEITKLVDEAIRQIERSGIAFRLIIPDPIYKTYGGRAENSNDEMAEVLNELGRLQRLTRAGVLFSHHYAKGLASLKSQIDRMAGAGVFARDPDTIITLTPHAEDKAYTVEVRTRYLPEPEAFVVKWQYPIMEVDGALNPADLKKPQVGGKEKCTNAGMLALLEDEMEKSEWKRLCVEKFNITTRTFDRRIKDYFTSAEIGTMNARLRKT